MNKDKIVLFGTSYMAEEYLKILSYLKKDVIVIGRNEQKANLLAKRYGYTGYGGSTTTLHNLQEEFNLAIIASSIESLRDICVECIKKNIKNILIEKPGALNLKELMNIKSKVTKDTKVWIAYNRRYYHSVKKLKEILSAEEIKGCFFDFTDREKDILGSQKGKEIKKMWGFVNSSHVIDLAFFLIGPPNEIFCNRSGSFDEHPTGTTFVGHGLSKKSLFSYFATWAGGGRWNVEISTNTGRYRLSPLEKLFFCKKNQFDWIEIEVKKDDFKPGLLEMVDSILNNKNILLPDLNEQIAFCKVIYKIFGYEGHD